MNKRSDFTVSLAVYFIAAVGIFLIIAAMVWVLRYNTRPAPLNQARIEERLKNLQEINAAASEALNNYAWQEQTKGLVRMPIADAMDLVAREWKNPSVGRSNLLARVERANP